MGPNEHRHDERCAGRDDAQMFEAWRHEGWQTAYGKGQADMLLSLAMMPEVDRERLLARARAQVVRVPMAPWDNPDAPDPRIKVHVDLTADDTPETVADKIDAALDDAERRGGNPADVRLDVAWDSPPGATR